jgi:4'-phosphopantetheinyl transferase
MPDDTQPAVTFLTRRDEPVRSLPAVRLVAVTSAAARQAALRGLAAQALGQPPEAVSIAHVPQRGAEIVAPAHSGLFLSSASRAGAAALAVARCPIGVDVEVVTPEIEIAWNAIHRDERESLAAMPEEERGRAFLTLWTVKEAYYKALQSGFGRDPTRFAVRLGDGTAQVSDPSFAGDTHITVRAVRMSGIDLVVSVALVPGGFPPPAARHGIA